MSSDQNAQIAGAFGEVIFLSYLIEDILRLDLIECSHLYVSGYQTSGGKIRKMKFVELILDLRKIYPRLECFADGLTRICKIRNKLVHALIEELGSNLRNAESRDQIHALFTRAILHAHNHLKRLKQLHGRLLHCAVNENLEAVLARDDPPFDGHVSTSKIQSLVGELDTLTKEYPAFDDIDL